VLNKFVFLARFAITQLLKRWLLRSEGIPNHTKCIDKFLQVPRMGLLQAEVRQRVCLQHGDHDGGGLAFDGDGGGWCCPKVP
jgi:hypothetical protein